MSSNEDKADKASRSDGTGSFGSQTGMRNATMVEPQYPNIISNREDAPKERNSELIDQNQSFERKAPVRTRVALKEVGKLAKGKEQLYEALSVIGKWFNSIEPLSNCSN